MSNSSPEQNGPLREQRTLTLRELTEAGNITISDPGKKTITFEIEGLTNIAPKEMSEEIVIDFDRMATACRSFGLGKITIGVDTNVQRNNFGIQISGLAGNAGTGEAVATGEKPISRAELEAMNERRIPHGARWGNGVITLVQQRINDETHKKDETLRNTAVRASVINQALIEGITDLGIKHLTTINKGDLAGVLLFTALAVSRVTGLPFDFHPISPLDVSLPDVVSNPLVIYIVTIFLTKFLSENVLNNEDTRLGELTPWGPEFIRALRAKTYSLPQVAERYPLVRSIRK